MLKHGEMALVFLFGGLFWLIVLGLTSPNYLEKLTDPLTIFTLLLAASTAGLWLANSYQLALTRDALALNREELALAREELLARSGVANQDLLNRVNTMLEEDPSLFNLWKIDPDKAFEEDGITASELVYIFAQLNASLAYHYTLGEQEVKLTESRKYFLQDKKVQSAWKNYLRKMFPGYAWTDAVDAYIAELDGQAAKVI